jgi:hypothetical protein
MALVGFLLCSTNACATDPKGVRPHLEGMSELPGALTYIFPVPAARANEAVAGVLRAHFTISYMRVGRKSDLEEYKRYSKIDTDFRHYEEKGKKYRKRCAATVYVIPEYPTYSEVDISCDFDVYELGLIHGRGGIHNLFTQWWDWYPERGLYIAEDLLELVSQGLELKDNEVVRLNKRDSIRYTKEERLQLIKERGAQRAR